MKTLLLVDLSGIFFRCWHATTDKETSAAYEQTLGMVHKLRDGYDYVAICLDAPPYERKKLHDGYKANREAAPPLALDQFRRVKERLAADGLLLWEHPGAEADDVIAWATKAALAQDGNAVITIASSDKDLLQLVEYWNDISTVRKVECLNPFDNKRYDRQAVIEKFGVAPEQMADFLALTGDSSDNVPGVKGIGAKTAAKLLMEFGALEGVLAAAPSLQSAIGQALIDQREAARLSKKLVTLRTDLPLNFAELFVERKPVKLEQREYDAETDKAEGPPPAETKSQAIERAQTRDIQPVAFEHGLEPMSINGAYKLACGMVESRLYSKFQNAEAIWAVMIRGREMGLGALTALDCFHVIQGRPTLSAQLIIARAKQHPECEYFQFVGGDDTYAEWVCKRRGNPMETKLKYTMEQALKAGLGQDNWKKRPSEMLRKTAAVQLARIEFPEASLGLVATEELEE